ncbi:Serine/threonine-protein kinase [Hibiscus syriacus]|uniref:Serine/threonine-protein kinase n=1 Tax=Hibiscus syriacus TaxID=106335 RepID=A0A6A2XHQ5_HIBSY|nr:Serine/threonine-protein kinase [Hibiscus syriacus]
MSKICGRILNIAMLMYSPRLATKQFRPDYILGEDNFGVIYKGVIDKIVRPGYKSTAVSVKELNPDGFQGDREWLTEVNYLGQLNHPNLVKLIGYCCDDDRRLLVYEYMARGSLEKNLFRNVIWFRLSVPIYSLLVRVGCSLTRFKRMKIALDAAKGLAFLHGAERPIIYRDFKTSKVLLDELKVVITCRLQCKALRLWTCKGWTNQRPDTCVDPSASGDNMFTHKRVSFLLDELNYLLWKQQVLLTVRSHRLEKLLNGDIQPPAATVTLANGSFVNFQHLDNFQLSANMAKLLVTDISHDRVSSVDAGYSVSPGSVVSSYGGGGGAQGGLSIGATQGSSSRGRGSGRNKFQCQLCGKIGHLVDRCWYRFYQTISGVGATVFSHDDRGSVTQSVVNVCIYGSSTLNVGCSSAKGFEQGGCALDGMHGRGSKDSENIGNRPG